MDIEKILKEYKRKRSLVDIALARIQAWRNALDRPETICFLVQTAGMEIGMPSSSIISSPVEKAVLSREKEIDDATNLVNEWIAEEESRIYWTKLEVEIIEKALESLTKAEKFIIECKYFEGMIWRDIEINYNEQYTKKQNYITESGLKKKEKEIREQLANILCYYYPKTA